MPPKKKPAADGEEDYEKQLRDNYVKACKTLGIDQSPILLKQLTIDEEEGPAHLQQICTEVELGPAGTRALCAAILAAGATMKGCGDPGAASVAEVLRKGPERVSLTQLELFDCQIGAEGCLSLGESLMLGANKSLLTLRLDHNSLIMDAGVAMLCKGLRTNRTITTLSLSYCNIGPEGAAALAQMLVFGGSTIKLLNLQGNKIRSEGVEVLAQALKRNTKCEQIVLADNEVGASLDEEVNTISLVALGEALVEPTAGLIKVDLTLNPIPVGAALAIAPFLNKETNKKTALFTIDHTLPPEIFEQLYRSGTGAKKAKKGKGKKGKGKKKK